jgi:NhaP-type Na+/H+ or K+/H+ antiporter
VTPVANEPSSWLNTITKATWTILFTAIGAFVAWQLFRRLLPALLVIAGLLFVYRMAIGAWRRNRW